MMDDVLKTYFSKYYGNTNISLGYLWSRLQKCESLSDCISIALEHKKIANSIKSDFIDVYIKRAAIIEAALNDAYFLREQFGDSQSLINLWKAIYDKKDASVFEVETMIEFSNRSKLISFDLNPETGASFINFGFRNSLTESGNKISFQLTEETAYGYTIEWLIETLNNLYETSLAQSKNQEFVKKYDEAKERYLLAESVYRFMKYEALPLPDWNVITGEKVKKKGNPGKKASYTKGQKQDWIEIYNRWVKNRDCTNHEAYEFIINKLKEVDRMPKTKPSKSTVLRAVGRVI